MMIPNILYGNGKISDFKTFFLLFVNKISWVKLLKICVFDAVYAAKANKLLIIKTFSQFFN